MTRRKPRFGRDPVTINGESTLGNPRLVMRAAARLAEVLAPVVARERAPGRLCVSKVGPEAPMAANLSPGR